MFYEALQKKMVTVIESTSGITAELNAEFNAEIPSE